MKIETTPNLFEEFITEFGGKEVLGSSSSSEPNDNPLINTNSGIESLDSNSFLKEFGEQPEKTEVDDEDDKKEEDDKQEEIKEDDSSEENAEEDEPVEISYKAIVENAAELGILDFEDSDDIQDDPDVLYNTIKKTIDKGINEYKDSLNTESKRFLEYLENGGDPRVLISVEASLFDIKNVDLEDEDNQKEVIKSYLMTQDYTPEEIEDQLTAYEDGLLLEKQAKLAVKKLEKIAEKQRETIIQEQEAVSQAQKDNYMKYIQSVEKQIKDSKEIAGLQISDKEKQEFEKYLLKVDKSGKTPYQLALEEDPIKTQIELAYLKFKNYDFKNVAVKAKSEATRELKKIFKSNEKTTSGKSATQKQTDDFSAFKSIWNK